jgi:hypothetical protein
MKGIGMSKFMVRATEESVAILSDCGDSFEYIHEWDCEVPCPTCGKPMPDKSGKQLAEAKALCDRLNAAWEGK